MKLPAKIMLFFHKWEYPESGEVLAEVYIVKPRSKIVRTKAEMYGKVWFIRRKGRLRIYRFEEFHGNRSSFHDDRELLEVFKNAQRLYVNENNKPQNVQEFIEFINAFKIVKPRIVKLCPLCLRDYNSLTILNPSSTYDYYDKDICKPCAIHEIQEDYLRRGIQLTASTRKFLNKQLADTKSVEKSVSILNQAYYADRSDSHTLYDVIAADTKHKVVPLESFLAKEVGENFFSHSLLKRWKELGITKLLPVQQLAIQNGLLNYQDLLIIAGTSSGKTFVGELAGLLTLKRRKQRFVFLTPLVALTNQKYEDFRKKYSPLGIRVVIRVGMSRIQVDEKEKIFIDGRTANADILVATYEAYDWILRNGQSKKLGDIGVLVIDEVQQLGDEERGQELDGIITRTKQIYPNCQVVALSATVGNPEEIAENYDMKLVEYNERPLALERNLVMTENPEEKENLIAKLIKDDKKQISSHKYPGRTLVFTNTRRRAQQLASILRSNSLRAAYYHAGMTFWDRKKIELNFEKGMYDVITTTAALGAGVDFPVSQVIFEKPAMGARWLTVAEFHQMFGRAGRYGYHDKGVTYLIVTIGDKIYQGMDRSEEQVAFDILTQPVEPVDVDIIFEREAEQVLAYVSTISPVTKRNVDEYYNKLFYQTKQLSTILETLQKTKMIQLKDKKVYITALGRAASSSYLHPLLAYQIAKETLKESPQKIAIRLSPFTNIHLSPKAQGEIERVTKTTMSSRFLSDGVIEFIFGKSAARSTWTALMGKMIGIWNTEFFNCNCKDRPYCEHPAQKISEKIVQLRLEGLKPKEIGFQLRSKYELFAYPGDLFSWLDELIHSLQAIERLAKAMKKNEIVSRAEKIILNISTGGQKYEQKKK